MRLAIMLSLSAAALTLSASVLGVDVSAAKPAPALFEGSWERCEKYRGIENCGYAVTTQRGNRICGVEGYWASGRTYNTRFVGTAAGTSMRTDKICGRPGSDTDTYCADQTPRNLDTDEMVGWGKARNIRDVCKGRLHSRTTDEVFDCATAVRDAGMPKVRRLTNDDGPDAQERAWLASCTAGRE